MAMQFKCAKRALSYLRLAIQGPSGSGKTFSALKPAKGLGDRIAVIDTERGSASLYADLPDMPEFDVLELDAPYKPERYVEAIKAARDAGYDVLVIDSMTHEWSSSGGCLELNDEIAVASTAATLGVRGPKLRLATELLWTQSFRLLCTSYRRPTPYRKKSMSER